MAIPQAQLETWSHQGSVAQSATTYDTIRRTLDDSSAPYAGQTYSIVLQGSYGNNTNIYADSDVDIVMRLDSAFEYDLGRLDESQKAGFDSAYPNNSYGLASFRKDVTDWLTSKFGAAVRPGKKAIFIKGEGNRRDADVLPCITFRRYNRFGNLSNQDYAEGICFRLANGTRIENFPKQHSENCTTKHQATTAWLKKTVRTYKNARNKMISDGLLADGVAPSYFIEGLLYNVRTDRFGGNCSLNFKDTLEWLERATDKSKFVCANEQFYLLNDHSPVTWRAADCDAFLKATRRLWDNW